MKKSKSRLLISLLTVFMMVFTVIPYVGAGNASAASDPYLWTNTDSYSIKNNVVHLIRSIQYEPQSDGNFTATVNIDVSALMQEDPQALSGADGFGYGWDTALGGESSGIRYYFNQDVYTLIIKDIKPGEEWNCKVWIGYDDYGDPPLSGYTFPYLTLTAPQLKAEDKPAVEINGDTRTISNIKKDSNGKVVHSETFYLSPKVAYFSVLLEHASYDYRDYNYKLELYDPSGNKVTAISTVNPYKWGSSDSTLATAGFTKTGNYTLKLTCGYTGNGTAGYKLTINSKNVKTYTYKYKTLSATLKDNGDVALEAGEFDSPTGKATEKAMYRVGGGKIIRIPWYDYDNNTRIDDIAKAPSTQYTYYVMDLTRLSSSNKSVLSAVGTSSVALTSAHQTALKDAAVTPSSSITTAKIQLTDITDLEYTTSVKKVTLEWNWNVTGGISSEVTGYRITVKDEKGKVRSDTHYAPENLFYIRKAVTIPYEGTSEVTITPYNKSAAGTYTYGNSKTISCKSKTLSKPTVIGVTKISNTKARIAFNKPTGAAGVYVYQKVNGKYQYRGYTTKNYYTCTKNTAGKKYYKLKAYVKDVPPGKTASKNYYSSLTSAFYPKANQATYNYSKYQSDYTDASHFWKPRKVYYSNGKLKVTGRWINTHNYRLDYFDVKVTVKYDGKTIGYKTIKCGKMKANSTKTHDAVTMSGSKSGYDLRNGQKTGDLKVTYKVVRWY